MKPAQQLTNVIPVKNNREGDDWSEVARSQVAHPNNVIPVKNNRGDGDWAVVANSQVAQLNNVARSQVAHPVNELILGTTPKKSEVSQHDSDDLRSWLQPEDTNRMFEELIAQDANGDNKRSRITTVQNDADDLLFGALGDETPAIKRSRIALPKLNAQNRVANRQQSWAADMPADMPADENIGDVNEGTYSQKSLQKKSAIKKILMNLAQKTNDEVSKNFLQKDEEAERADLLLQALLPGGDMAELNEVSSQKLGHGQPTGMGDIAEMNEQFIEKRAVSDDVTLYSSHEQAAGDEGSRGEVARRKRYLFNDNDVTRRGAKEINYDDRWNGDGWMAQETNDPWRERKYTTTQGFPNNLPTSSNNQPELLGSWRSRIFEEPIQTHRSGSQTESKFWQTIENSFPIRAANYGALRRMQPAKIRHMRRYHDWYGPQSID